LRCKVLVIGCCLPPDTTLSLTLSTSFLQQAPQHDSRRNCSACFNDLMYIGADVIAMLLSI
jgi:hypothetical protein